MSWTEIGRYNASTPDGDVETVILEKDKEGNFRIKNDFGNNVFEFERMSGYEIFRKLNREVNDDLESDLNNTWDDFYSDGDSEEPTVYDYSDCDYDGKI